MDNQTRRILLERVKASGFPGSILDVFQNPAILDQFIAEQQQSQLQQPQNIQVVAETPEQQRQGLRPYHNNNITNVEMAFPNVEANQVINTERMKIPINVDVIKQGNLVQSFKAIPPGIANFPTGAPEGSTLIESPAEGYQKGGFHQRIYTDPEEFRVANQNYNDSLDVYNLSEYNWKQAKDYGMLTDEGIVYISDDEIENIPQKKINTYLQPISKRYTTSDYYSTGYGGINKEFPIYKKPTEEPIYREKLNLQNIPYKGLSINSNPPSLGDMTSIINSSPLSYKYQLQPGVYGNQIRVGVYQDGKYQPFSKERIQNEIEENRIPDQREENYLRIQKLKGYQTGGGVKPTFLLPEKEQKEYYEYLSNRNKKTRPLTEEEKALISGDTHNLPDSKLENIGELFDFTGVLSHDDAQRAYESWKKSGRSTPTLQEELDMFSAVPGLGKYGRITYMVPNSGPKIAFKTFPWQETVNFFGQEGMFGPTNQEEGKNSKKYGGVRTYLKGGLKNRVLYNKAKYKR